MKMDMRTWILIVVAFCCQSCAGFDTYFPMHNLKLTLPVYNETIAILKTTPLEIFHAKRVVTSTADDNNDVFDYFYDVGSQESHPRPSLFRIKNGTGELWMHEVFNSNATNSTDFEIFAQESPNQMPSAIMSLHVDFKPFRNTTKDVCREYSQQLCFWNSVNFQLAETDGNVNGTVQRIGQLSPQIFRTLCPNAEVRYNLVNATDYLSIKNGTLYSKIAFDHDTYNPGPELSAHIECFLHLRPNEIPLVHEKVFNITILDLNDNGIFVQAGNQTVSIELKQPHFVKSAPVDSRSIIFLDNDSLSANSKISYRIYGDKLDIIRPVCSAYESDHRGLRSSVFHCRLTFARDGILRQPEYCIVLQARDTNLTNEIERSKAKICLIPDLSKIHESDQMPTPLALTGNSDRQGKKKNKKLRSEDENMVNGPIVEYPNRTVFVYNTTFTLARLAQPINDVTNKKIRFRLVENPLNAFAVTELGGILYVSNAEALENQPEHTMHVVIGWARETATIEVKYLYYTGNKTCPNIGEETNSSINENFMCSIHITEQNCTSFCGDGSISGFCQWRQSKAVPGTLTSSYSTCSYDLVYCPDKKCDPLEDLAHRNGWYICPQDCVRQNNVRGPAFLQNDGKGPGIRETSGLCSCTGNGKCVCQQAEMLVELDKRHQEEEEERRRNEELRTTLVTELVKQDFFQSDYNVWLIVIPIMLLIILIIVLTSYCMSQSRKRDLMDEPHKRGSNDTEIINMININITNHKFDFNTKWEFPRTNLELDAMLGEGEFGRVVKGFAAGLSGVPEEKSIVAVKMLKTGANSVEFEALLSEFQSLQDLSHPNVIKLLGVCSKDDTTPLLIIEYCMYGSLRNYLRTSRKVETKDVDYTNDVEQVTVKDILSFAWQICKGMTYLAENRLVHRDLAARNILLAEGKVCKISDFGLTRDVYEDDAYLKRSKDRVPVKWMAPESLADHKYTTRSDVWAFGVVGWELVKLGASPYPGIEPQDLYGLLMKGYRMPRPENCSEEIYSIIRSCWAEDEKARPSFKHLTNQWETLLGKTAKYLDFDQNCVTNPTYVENNNLPVEQEFTEKDELVRLEHLWYHPLYPSLSNTNAVDNRKYLEAGQKDLRRGSNVTTTTMSTIVPDGYDIPRSLIETKTVERLRYQNELPHTAVNFYHNQATTSATNLLMLNYDSPVKRCKSYIDMRSLNKQLEHRTSCDYNDHDEACGGSGSQNGPCKGGKSIKNNLNVNIGDKSVGKDITFRFSSANNLQDVKISM